MTKEVKQEETEATLDTNGVGLALSGGGYRATLFHIGSLWRLNEIGYLKKLSEVTSVSGGSITAGWLGLQWNDLKFDKNGVADNFVEDVVNPLREFCSHGIEGEAFLFGLDNPYRRKLFHKATLQDLPSDEEGPRFTIYATSLQTGVSVRLARPYLADYNLGYVQDPGSSDKDPGSSVKGPGISLAKAVAASSAFPPVMWPVILKFKPAHWKDWKPQKGEVPKEIPGKEKMRRRMALTDGGVYDNLGLERIWDRYKTVLISDAGAPFSTTTGTCCRGWNRLGVTLRVINTVTEQTRRLRKRWAVADFAAKKTKGTYWGIATDIGDYDLEEHGLPPPLLKDDEDTEALAHIRTRLNSFSQKEQEELINWGYALADAAMRRWVLDKKAKPGQLPYPK